MSNVVSHKQNFFSCKNIDIDFRNIINIQIHLLFLAAGLLQDNAHEKNLVNVYIFQ